MELFKTYLCFCNCDPRRLSSRVRKLVSPDVVCILCTVNSQYKSIFDVQIEVKNGGHRYFFFFKITMKAGPHLTFICIPSVAQQLSNENYKNINWFLLNILFIITNSYILCICIKYLFTYTQLFTLRNHYIIIKCFITTSFFGNKPDFFSLSAYLLKPKIEWTLLDICM